jgi:long-chain acyl-CoA synthetase
MIRRLRLVRNRELTLATFLDGLLPLYGSQPVSYVPDFAGLDGAPEPMQNLADLYREVGAMSRFLVEETALRRGDRVAIFKSNDPRCFRWFLAVIRAGGVAVPLNPLLTLAELRAIVSRCGVSTMVTDRAVFGSTIGSLDALAVRRWVQSGDDAALDGFLRLTAEWLQAPPPPPASIKPSDTVAVFHTSGTNGFPKGAMLSSQTLLAGRALALLSAPLVGRRALALFPLPWAHIMAVSAAVYGLLAGVPGYFLPRFETQAAIAAIEEHGITIVVGVPAMFIRLVNAAPSPESLASVRLWVSASDHLPDSYRRRLLQYGALFRGPGRLRLGPIFVNAYGMVELGGIAMCGTDAPFLPGSGQLCLPVPPFRVRVANERGEPARPGEIGECQVRGPGVTGRYWGDSRSEAGSLAPGEWLRTGDLAVRNRAGLVRLAGRAKDIIKCGGYSIFAREIEEALLAHPAVAQAVAIGVPHPDKGEAPMAIVECRPGFSLAEEELLSWSRQRLAAYKLPRSIRLADPGSLPQGVTEKVLKRVLRQQYAGEFR